MKPMFSFRWLVALAVFAGVALSGCGSNDGGMAVSGPEGMPRLGKAAVEMQQAGVSIIVTHLEGDVLEPVSGAEVALARCVAGQAANYQWTATANLNGIARIELAESEDVSGYYIARATDPETGEVVGTWHSIPVNGGSEHVVSLSEGQKCAHISLRGPIDFVKALGYRFSEPSFEGFPGKTERLYMWVFIQNTRGEWQSLLSGHTIYRDIDLDAWEASPGARVVQNNHVWITGSPGRLIPIENSDGMYRATSLREWGLEAWSVSRFWERPDIPGQYSYRWVTGNVSGPVDMTDEELIAAFLQAESEGRVLNGSDDLTNPTVDIYPGAF